MRSILATVNCVSYIVAFAITGMLGCAYQIRPTFRTLTPDGQIRSRALRASCINDNYWYNIDSSSLECKQGKDSSALECKSGQSGIVLLAYRKPDQKSPSGRLSVGIDIRNDPDVQHNDVVVLLFDANGSGGEWDKGDFALKVNIVEKNVYIDHTSSSDPHKERCNVPVGSIIYYHYDGQRWRQFTDVDDIVVARTGFDYGGTLDADMRIWSLEIDMPVKYSSSNGTLLFPLNLGPGTNNNVRAGLYVYAADGRSSSGTCPPERHLCWPGSLKPPPQCTYDPSLLKAKPADLKTSVLKSYQLTVSSTTGGSVFPKLHKDILYRDTVVSSVDSVEVGNHFLGWTRVNGDVSILDPKSPTTRVVVRANGHVQATFAPKTYILTVQCNEGGHAEPQGPVVVRHGLGQPLMAMEDTGHLFVGWSTVSGSPHIGAPKSSNTNVTLVNGDACVQASFVKKETPNPQIASCNLVVAPGSVIWINGGGFGSVTGNASVRLANNVVLTLTIREWTDTWIDAIIGYEYANIGLRPSQARLMLTTAKGKESNQIQIAFEPLYCSYIGQGWSKDLQGYGGGNHADGAAFKGKTLSDADFFVQKTESSHRGDGWSELRVPFANGRSLEQGYHMGVGWVGSGTMRIEYIIRGPRGISPPSVDGMTWTFLQDL